MTTASERQFSAPERQKLAHKGAAMPDGSFPINNAADLKNAIRLAGRAKDPVKARQHIIGRAKALKLMALIPKEWMTDKKPAKEAEAGPVEHRATETMPAFEAVWSDNAEGMPQADVVIIRPGESANRRMYSREAIQDAVNRDFWGGTPMFIDHGERGMPRKRSVRDLVARIEPGSSYTGMEGEARAKVTFINPEFAKLARAAGKAIGLSAVHEFMGQRFRGNDGHNHERVDKMVVSHSVDFVAFPAAGGEVAKFLPAMESESEDDVDWKALDEEMLREHRPDLVDGILAAAEADDPDDKGDDGVPFPQPRPGPGEPPAPEPEPPKGYVSLATVRAIAHEAAEQVRDEYEAKSKAQAEARVQIGAHVNRSGLPDKTKTRILTAFEGQETYNAEAVQGAIEEAAAEARELGWRGPVIKGFGSSTAAEGDEQPLSAEEKKKVIPTAMAFESQMEYTPPTGVGKGSAN